MVRVENYYILLNSNLDKYYVYTLIDNNFENKLKLNGQEVDIEFYGFINIGYLINPRGYTIDEINKYENENDIKFKDDFKKYILNTSIFKYETKLFHINLKNEDIKNKFIYNGKKHIKDNDIKFDGLLYLGIYNKKTIVDEIDSNNISYIIKNMENIYILVNYDECTNINYNFSIWKYIYINNNYDDLENITDLPSNLTISLTHINNFTF
jgi:hypothetical protein